MFRLVLCHFHRFMQLGYPLALGVLTLAGCEKTPGGQVVAVVGTQEITRRDLNAEMAAADVPLTNVAARADILDRLVDQAVLIEYAWKRDLDRTPKFLMKERRAEQALLAAEALETLSTRSSSPSLRDARDFIAAHPPIFANRQRLLIDQIRIGRTDARESGVGRSAIESLDAIAATLTAKSIRFGRTRSVIDTAAIDPALARELAAKAVGQVFVSDDRGDMVIAVIESVEDAATPHASWLPQARAILRSRIADENLDRAIADLRRGTSVLYDVAVLNAN